MTSQRPTRLAEVVKVEVSQIIQREMKDPRLGFVSVTDVEVTRDLSLVRVFVSVLGDEASLRDSMKALESATGFIRSELGKRIQLRHTPEVSFVHDNSIERGSHISKILNDIKKTEQTQGPTE